MRVGVVAGTSKGCLPQLVSQLEGVDLILHAGIIGGPAVLDALRDVAPVRAVVGHRDFLDLGDRLPETAVIEVNTGRIVVTHLAGEPPSFLPPVLRQLQQPDAPDLLVHGHPPTSSAIWIGGTLVFAPGHARGTPRGRRGTLGIIEIEPGLPITAHVYDLATREPRPSAELFEKKAADSP